MRNLFAFIYTYRGFLVFLLLEIVCGYLIVQHNNYQGAAFFNSANTYAGRMLEYQKQVSDYFRLVEVNRALVNENRKLHESLNKLVYSGILDSIPAMPDSTYRLKPDSLQLARQKLDTTGIMKTFRFIPGKVVKNSIHLLNNHLTLNIGAADGVKPGMGVVSSAGVIGRVKNVSANYATVYSLLHTKMYVAVKLKRNNIIGSITWKGNDHRYANLEGITRDNTIRKGDTVITSGYNALFPEGVLVGRIASFAKEANQSFYTIKIGLTPDFDNLSYVYVIENLTRAERDSLEIKSGIAENE